MSIREVILDEDTKLDKTIEELLDIIKEFKIGTIIRTSNKEYSIELYERIINNYSNDKSGEYLIKIVKENEVD